MPGTATGNLHIHVTSLWGLVGFVVLWLALVEGTKLLFKAFRNDPLIGWAVGPFGVSTLFSKHSFGALYFVEYDLPDACLRCDPLSRAVYWLAKPAFAAA